MHVASSDACFFWASTIDNHVSQLVVEVRNLGFDWLHGGPERCGMPKLRLVLHVVSAPTLIVVSHLRHCNVFLAFLM